MALASDSPTVPRSRRGSRLYDHQMTYLAVSVRGLVLTVACGTGRATASLLWYSVAGHQDQDSNSGFISLSPHPCLAGRQT